MKKIYFKTSWSEQRSIMRIYALTALNKLKNCHVQCSPQEFLKGLRLAGQVIGQGVGEMFMVCRDYY